MKTPSGRYIVHRIEPNTFAAVIRAYLASPHYAKLALSTQQGYLTYLKIAELPGILGDIPITVIRASMVQKFLDGLSERPGAQQRARVALKAVEAYALPRDLLLNPIMTGTTIIGSDGGHQPWTEEQVGLAERFAKPEIARIITLAANTGQRGSDLIRMRWSDIEEVDGRLGINVTQRKTGLQIWIPFTQALQATMATWERRPTQILLTPRGQPYPDRRMLTQAWVRERDSNEGLWGCATLVLHGLRATAVVRLRRAGATTPQIVDMVGLSAQMVERYSRFADQRKSALAAVIHLDQNRPEQETKKGIKGPPVSS